MKYVQWKALEAVGTVASNVPLMSLLTRDRCHSAVTINNQCHNFEKYLSYLLEIPLSLAGESSLQLCFLDFTLFWPELDWRSIGLVTFSFFYMFHLECLQHYINSDHQYPPMHILHFWITLWVYSQYLLLPLSHISFSLIFNYCRWMNALPMNNLAICSLAVYGPQHWSHYLCTTWCANHVHTILDKLHEIRKVKIGKRFISKTTTHLHWWA